MRSTPVTAPSALRDDTAKLPVAHAVILEATKLSERLAALEQNGDPAEQAQIMSRLRGALSLMRGKSNSTEPSATLSPTAGREITLADGSRAIEMHVPVNEEIIRAVLSDASFNKTRSDQVAYAQGLGGRLATREEHRAVINDLLEKEENRTLNDAEQKLIKALRENYVRDSEGRLLVDGRCVYAYFSFLYDRGIPYYGALVVLPLAESK